MKLEEMLKEMKYAGIGKSLKSSELERETLRIQNLLADMEDAFIVSLDEKQKTEFFEMVEVLDEYLEKLELEKLYYGYMLGKTLSN